MREELPRHKVKLMLAIVCMMTAAATTATTGYLIDPAIKEIFLNKNMDLLYTLPMVIIGVSALRGLSPKARAYCMGGIGTKIVNHLQIRMLKKLLVCDLAYFSKHHSGSFLPKL